MIEESFRSSYIPTRSFGRTGIQIPILSLGGMRFQQSWQELEVRDIQFDSQQNLNHLLNRAAVLGLHHVETARHYGSSELQLGLELSQVPDPSRLLQTKVPPREDPKEFEAELELSFQKLQCQKLDFLAIHGLNLPDHLDQTVRPGGCLEVVRRWQKEGKIGHVGFSTHGSADLIVKAIETNEFDYVNLHWYFIYQDNARALEAASKHGLGIFIISPTDKGGHLHSPSQKLLELCAPLHPIVFNDLFCLDDPRIHTISVGASKPEDLDLHLAAIGLLDQASELLPPIERRLHAAACSTLGATWLSSWKTGLPSWEKTPGDMNIPVLLWLYNLLEAWGMEGYVKARYGLLGNGSHWFPGENANCLDREVSEKDLKKVLVKSPWMNEIPDFLRSLRERVAGDSQKRLSSF